MSILCKPSKNKSTFRYIEGNCRNPKIIKDIKASREEKQTHIKKCRLITNFLSEKRCQNIVSNIVKVLSENNCQPEALHLNDHIIVRIY